MATRFHLAPQGPDICRADPSNPRSKGCPFGGESGNENHFATMAEAEAAYAEQMEANGNGLVATAATAASAKDQEPALTATLKPIYRSKLDALVADSSYGISRTSSGKLVADGTEGLEKLRSAFVDSTGDELDPDVYYEPDSDSEVISSIYIKELDIEIENQNANEDLRELRGYWQMRADDAREYWR